MPTKLKQLVEARRAKTGESHQTALRHVRAQAKGSPPPRPPCLKALVLEVARLAYERAAAHARSAAGASGPLRTRHAGDFEDATGADDTALRALLESVPLEALHKVEALMYAGRSGFDVLETFREIPKEDKEGTVRTLLGKLPLGEYLEFGLERAADAKLDLDSDFSAYPEPPRSYVIDMNHTVQALDPSAKVPEAAREFAEYVGAIVLAASAAPRERPATPGLECRQCSELLEVRVFGRPAKVAWECPECGERGQVSNWQGTLWDAGSGGGSVH